MSRNDGLEDEVARWTRELRKGSIRLALLALLAEGDSYGYQVLTDLRARGLEALQASEATVYPLLHELEKKGYLSSAWRTTDTGVPPRKYYTLTATGVALHEALVEAWGRYRSEIDRLLDRRARGEEPDGR